jgi:hypothetical protein
MNSLAPQYVTRIFLLLALALFGTSHPINAFAQSPNTTSPYANWKHTGSLWILTTPEGADLPQSAAVEQFPLLVQLHQDFFDFRQAKPQGEDLRFSSSSGEPLAYQIEDWDAKRGVANLWVRIPKIRGASRQELKLHWGKEDATSESSGKAVFGPSNDYLSVWHMNETAPDTQTQDEVGTLTMRGTGTTSTKGVIASARRFTEGKGLFGGDKITTYPVGASPHSTEAWFRAERPNTTLIAWGNEERQGKVVMQFRSPPHIRMDCYFSDANVHSDSRITLGEWTHVVHTYQDGEAKLYINGVLDGANKKQGSPLNIKSPAKLWIGGWYDNYDFLGDLDEVRISKVARSAEWIKLQYENQKPNQTLVGPLVKSGSDFSVSSKQITVDEGQVAAITASAGGAQKVYWILKQNDRESIVATNRFQYNYTPGRITGNNQSAVLQFKAIYADSVKTLDIPITVKEQIPDPTFTLTAPPDWDGRTTLEITSQITNLEGLKAKSADKLNFTWATDDVAVIKKIEAEKLTLKRSQGNGKLRVSLSLDNGGAKITQSININVTQPLPGSEKNSKEKWLPRPITKNEQPEDNQFIAREGFDRDGVREGSVVHAGVLENLADSVFLRVYADDRIFATVAGKVAADKSYSLTAKLKAGLVKYRTEFGAKTGDKETVLHTASNLVCGDAYIIIGQSNAVATDFGEGKPPERSDWIRSFGARDTEPHGARKKLWAPATARGEGGNAEIGYWGMDLARRLVESQKIPICIINGAVGGTRIDQHQKNIADPTDVSTIYGRLLWRVQEAKLTHGIRAILWHQGENDQGADGPTGGYGFETYRNYFVDLSAAWKEDYPNVQNYYLFQIWPKSCAMGINGSDNQLREVQRTLPTLYSNLSVMSTLGIKPPGGCHFPAEGYAEFARLIAPLVERDIYHKMFGKPITPPNLKRAAFTTAARDELVLQFDQPITWSEKLTSQFHLDGESNKVASGAAIGNDLLLKLKGPTKSSKITYLDSANWNPNNLLQGQNGIATLTFCDVAIESRP